jgi:DNA (cytosine-5)-methyltransferase 1
MTTLPERIRSGEVEAPDVFCGGTPCQAFSFAGKRQSLNDARGNLSLIFCEVANAIDNVRHDRGEQPSIVFWENVPGVLSTKDNAFGCFLAGLAGEDEPLQPSGKRWPDAGCVLGPQRAVAWRVLDAQYFGLAQRRKRVFVVSSARNDFDPAAVLFEWGGLRRDTAPSREAGKTVAPTIAGCAFVQNTRDEVRLMGGDGSIVGALAAQPGMKQQCYVTQPVAFSQNQLGEVRAGSVFNTINTNSNASGRNTPMVAVMQPIPIDTMNHIGRGDNHSFGDFEPGAPSYTLTKGHSHAVAYGIMPMNSGKDYKARVAGNAGGMLAFDILGTPATNGAKATDIHVPLRARAPGASEASTTTVLVTPAVKQPISWSEELTASVDVAGTIQRGGDGGRHAGDMTPAMQVRRLTPVECERLQGFPDNYTAIPWRKKPASECPDGPRYKALGNSWAVPVVRWIGRRIECLLGAAIGATMTTALAVDKETP